jgi:hypothetical protein
VAREAEEEMLAREEQQQPLCRAKAWGEGCSELQAGNAILEIQKPPRVRCLWDCGVERLIEGGKARL